MYEKRVHWIYIHNMHTQEDQRPLTFANSYNFTVYFWVAPVPDHLSFQNLIWWLIIGCVLFHVDQVSPHHNLLFSVLSLILRSIQFHLPLVVCRSVERFGALLPSSGSSVECGHFGSVTPQQYFLFIIRVHFLHIIIRHQPSFLTFRLSPHDPM